MQAESGSSDVQLSGDRRRHGRHRVTKGCKVFHWRTHRYLSAKVCDVSPGGVLLRLDGARPVSPDDEIDVLISWDDRALVRSADQISGRVLRAQGTMGGEQFVAVKFNREVGVAAAA